MSDRTVHLSRRTFLRAAAVSAGALAAGGVGVLGAPTRSRAAARNPLFLPPEAAPNDFALTARSAVVDLGGGPTSSVLAYNGLLPGPTIRAQKGAEAGLLLTNQLAEETTIHWHGMIVPTPADGHPRDAVASGGSRKYEFPIVQRACMNWYHPHPDTRTGRQVALGLAGAFIVNDAKEATLGLPSGAYEVPLVVRDAVLDSSGSIVYKPKTSGYLGNVPLVNGTRDATLEVDAALYRLRVLNGANARVFQLALGNEAAFTLIGNDGGLLRAPKQLKRVTFGPGERLDLLLDLRAMQVGQSVMLRDLRAGWDLLEFAVARQVSPGGVIPAAPLSSIKALPAPVRTRDFSFDGMSRINGRVYDLERIDFRVPFGDTELWRFTTGGNAPHPVHVHGASFQVQSRTGGRGKVFPWERGWKDTVLLEDGETVEVLIRFEAYRGLYLMHCHKLEHEDAGMMANFEVF